MMARRTQYEALLKDHLYNAVYDTDRMDSVWSWLDSVSNTLHTRDGWVSYPEIWEAVYEAAVEVCRRGRRPEWAQVRESVVAWYNSKGAAAQAVQ